MTPGLDRPDAMLPLTPFTVLIDEDGYVAGYGLTPENAVARLRQALQALDEALRNAPPQSAALPNRLPREAVLRSGLHEALREAFHSFERAYAPPRAARSDDPE
jgi:hypothetical protein